MGLLRLPRSLASTAKVLATDLLDWGRSHGRGLEKDLTPPEKKALEDLRRDGFAVIPDFYPRDKALELRGRLEAHLASGANKDYENGAYLRFWDDRDYDEGVRRLYHVDRLEPELKLFREDPSIARIARAYYGFPIYSGVLVFQHNTQSNSKTRCFHVDAFSKEFKSFLYLDDVDEGNGPFTYLRGSHQRHLLRVKKQIIGSADGSPTSFAQEDLTGVLENEVKVCGKAGTLILADVRGIHRGSPQSVRSRSVIVNYCYTHPGDVYLDR